MKNLKYKILITILSLSVFLGAFFYGGIAMEDILFDTTLSTGGTDQINTVFLLTDEVSDLRLDTINIKYNGKSVFVGEVYSKSNRFFLPLNKFVTSVGGSFLQEENLVTTHLGKATVFDLKAGAVLDSPLSVSLKNPFILSDNYYLSVFDLCQSLSLYCDWDNSTKTLSFVSGYKAPAPEETNHRNTRQALIRLEDIAPTNSNSTSGDDLLKQRVIADLLYTKGVPFSVALVPRYINYEKGIDNSVSDNYSFYNAQFVYTLDYYLGRGGTIGLHGYTHQNGTGNSLIDKEFGKEVNLSPEEAKERIDLAIESCEKLDITPAFFAFPHYFCTETEYKLAAKRFDCIYHTPSKQVDYLRQGLHRTKLVPTPLQYVDPAVDLDGLLSQIESLDKNTLMSLFYHPFIEYNFITIQRDGGGLMPTVDYPDDTPLHKIVSTIQETGATFVSITDVR